MHEISRKKQMAVIKAFAGGAPAVHSRTCRRDIITAGPFTRNTPSLCRAFPAEATTMATNEYGSEGIITNGSRIYVPDTAAFISLKQVSKTSSPSRAVMNIATGSRACSPETASDRCSIRLPIDSPSEVKLAAPNMWPSSTCVRFVASNSALLRRWCITTGSMASIWKFAHAHHVAKGH